MAGIGFEIKKILLKGSYFSLIKTYGIASIIGSGPWVLSIFSVFVIGLIAKKWIDNDILVVQFLVCVTYLMAFSLIITGFLQLMFTRFVADKLFSKENNIVFPNLMGAIWLVSIVSLIFAGTICISLFNESITFNILLTTNFVVLCNLWIVVLFVSSMKEYTTILFLFIVGYSTAIILSTKLVWFKIDGLLLSVLIGHSIILFGLLFNIVRNYPGSSLIRFDFLKTKHIFISLVFTGFFFNLAIWLDKIIFWFNPQTSQQIIGPLRASIIYDLPIFIAYLSLIPGMAVFMVRMEADFAQSFENFYNAIRDGDSLERINYFKNQMIFIARQGIYEIFKVQGFVLVLLILWGKDILKVFGISQLYAPLFYIDCVSVSIQLLLLSIMNFLFYLDLRWIALSLSLCFLVLNCVLTMISISLGVTFYGYGYACATAITALLGLLLLGSKMEKLEYETFMLR